MCRSVVTLTLPQLSKKQPFTTYTNNFTDDDVMGVAGTALPSSLARRRVA